MAGRFGGTRDGPAKPFTEEDIRFTTKGTALYAIAPGWPENGALVAKSLAANSRPLATDIKKVELPGWRDRLKWHRGDDGQVGEFPAKKPCDHAFVLRISTGG